MTFFSALLLILLSILTLLHIILMIVLRQSLNRSFPAEAGNSPFVSVLVAARNEAGNIEACMSALALQDYPSDRFEVIVIDDRSGDSTGALIDDYCRNRKNFIALHIQKTNEEMAPKKWALQKGIDRSGGEIILTTDADCTPPPKWIRGMTACFTPGIGFVAGFSPLNRVDKETLLNQFILIDGLALAGLAAAGISLGIPLTCTARNIAYRRAAFEEAGGFSALREFISGDDDLLMHKVHQQTDWKLAYAASPDTYVPSIPVKTLRAFVSQRIRHASKGKYYSARLKFFLVSFYLLNLLLFLFWLLPGSGIVYLLFFLLKAAADGLFLFKVADHFRMRTALRIYPLAALLHIPYVVILGLVGQTGKFRWKGTVYSARQKDSV